MINRDKKVFKMLTVFLIVAISLFLFLGLSKFNYKYVLPKRVIRLLGLSISGIAIAVSSVIFQTITDNRILTPSSLGLDSLYTLIQTSLIFFLGSTSIFILKPTYNFFLSLLLMIIFSKILYGKLIKSRINIMSLLLVGIVMGTFFSSLSSFLQMIIDPNEFLHIQDKMFASFNALDDRLLITSLLILFISLIYIFKEANKLDVLSLGRDQSINLGLNYFSFVDNQLFIVSVLVSLSTALVGPIGFLGLLVVNLSKELLTSFSHRDLFKLSSLIAVIFLLISQLIIERVFNYSLC